MSLKKNFQAYISILNLIMLIIKNYIFNVHSKMWDVFKFK